PPSASAPAPISWCSGPTVRTTGAGTGMCSFRSASAGSSRTAWWRSIRRRRVRSSRRGGRSRPRAPHHSGLAGTYRWTAVRRRQIMTPKRTEAPEMTAPEITTYDPAALRALWYREGFYSDRTWPDVLAESCAAGAATTVVYAGSGGTQLVTTVGEIHTLARRVAAARQVRGVRPGDTVAVQLPTRIEASIAYAAVLLAGAVLVPIVHIYGPNEVRFILEQSGAKVLVQPDRWRAADYGDRVAAYAGIPGLEQIVVVGETVSAGAVGWDELVTTTAVYTRPAVHADDIALLIYTSGTTSAPKGVQHSHNSLLAEQWSAPQYLGSGDDAVQLVSFPPGHIASVGSVLRPLLHVQDT